MIMDRNECKNACDILEMMTGTLKNNKVCYRAGNGKCRQDGRFNGQNTKISLICKSTSNGNYLFQKAMPHFRRKYTQQISAVETILLESYASIFRKY